MGRKQQRMKWSRRPSCSLLTSLAAVTTTSHSPTSTPVLASGSGVSAFYIRRCGRVGAFFSSKTSSSDSDTRPRVTLPSPYFTYTLGNSTGSYSDTLYVPFTSFCNARTLPQIRGPNFRLPPHVVAALCRVRDEEICSINTNCGSETGTESDSTLTTTTTKAQKKYSFWCQWLDTQESYQMLPPPLPESLAPQSPTTQIDMTMRRPTVDELMVEVQQWYDYNTRNDVANSSNYSTPITIVIAGEGEPTICLYDLMHFIQQLHSFIKLRRPDCTDDAINIANGMPGPPNVRLRIMTNGLLTPEQTHELLQCCSSTASVTPLLPIILSVLFITSDPIQYNNIMEPILSSVNVPEDQHATTLPHEMVQQFIRTVADVVSKQPLLPLPLLSIEVTAIDRPDVDKDALSKQIKSLGVTTPIRWRPYFP